MTDFPPLPVRTRPLSARSIATLKRLDAVCARILAREEAECGADAATENATPATSQVEVDGRLPAA